MSERQSRDYIGWAVVAGATALGWLARKLSSKYSGAFAPAAGSIPHVPALQSRLASPRSTMHSGSTQLPVPPWHIERNREQVGTFFVLCAFVISFVTAVGFVVAYWNASRNEVLGGMLAISFFSFGAGLVLWSHWLANEEEITDVREPLPSAPQERESVAQDLLAEQQAERRGLLLGMSAAIFAALAAGVVSLLRSFGISPEPSLRATVWTRGQRLVTIGGDPVTIGTLQPGDTISVFPENQVGSVNAQTVLLRVNESALRLPRERTGWAPSGYLAYSRVCTHAGCSVGVYESTTCLLQCPCHQSTFDVLSAARPTGGPAARPLPQLPLYADENGNLRAGGDFSEPPGPGFWGMP